MQQQNTSQENAYHQEWAYVKGRGFALNLLAIGSLVVTFRLGLFIGQMASSNHYIVFLIQGVFMWLAYMAVDWVLKNALSAASNVKMGDVPSPTPKSVIGFAAVAMITTIALSIVSNPFISSELSGKSHLHELNTEIISAIKRDSSLKMAAFSTLQEAGETEKKRIQAAYKGKQSLIQMAVAKGSPSWQRDYQLHKNNPKAWFWTCRKCPKEYKTYRDNIRHAMQEGDKIISLAEGYTSSIQSNLAPTLKYQASEDTLLHFMRHTPSNWKTSVKTPKNASILFCW